MPSLCHQVVLAASTKTTAIKEVVHKYFDRKTAKATLAEYSEDVKKALAFVCQAFLSWMEDNGEEISKKYNANEVLEITVKVIRAYQQNLGSNGWHAQII